MVYDVGMLVRTQILLPKETYDLLKLEAAIRETSMSKLVTKAVDKCVIKKKKKMSGREFVDFLVKHAYKGKVPSDLSTNDNYLYGLKTG